MLMHFNDTRMGIEVGILGTGIASRTFWKKLFLVSVQITWK